MADTENTFALRSWSLATFHTAGFVASVVVGVHLSGSLAARLGRLDTQTGVAFFLALWALTWYATRAGLLKMDPHIEEASSGSVVMWTTVAGGWNGVGIFALLLLAFIVASMFSHAAGFTLVPVLFFVAVLGCALAFTTGAVVGLVFGLTDALLLGCSAALFRWACGDLDDAQRTRRRPEPGPR